MDFDTIYGDVPDEQKIALKQFRDNHPQKTLIVNDIEWTYHIVGGGTETILWLVGGLKKADAAYKSIPLLADDYRIIAPDYPALSSIADLADGLASILTAENVDSVFVLAGSFGGMLAQVFMRRHPDKVKKVVLSTTTPPDKSHVNRYQQLMEMAKLAPDALLRDTAQTQMLSTIAPPDNEVDFYKAYLKELYEQRLNKEDIVSIYSAIIDYMEQVFTPDDLQNWSGELLIINSDNDATFGEATQKTLVDLYPTAQVHTFEGAGHSPGSTQREAFFALVRDFFN